MALKVLDGPFIIIYPKSNACDSLVQMKIRARSWIFCLSNGILRLHSMTTLQGLTTKQLERKSLSTPIHGAAPLIHINTPIDGAK